MDKSLSNTQLRVISAIVLVILVIISVALGKTSALITIGILGYLVIDEVIVNFLNYKRSHISYLISAISYILAYSYVNFLEPIPSFLIAFNNLGLFLNLMLIAFLFISKMSSRHIYNFLSKNTFIVGLIILIPILNLATLVHSKSNWIIYLSGLFLLNFSVDTFAWFFGKKFGKHKLWEAVSPKKTIEGLVGGVLSSVIIIAFYWILAFSSISFQLLISFLIIACCAQLGDLIQSKLKRQFSIKDSSNLIPGHGGVYDRVDSLLFVVPFYLFVIKNLV